MKGINRALNPCWERESNTSCARFELSELHQIVLPYISLKRAELDRSNQSEMILVKFTDVTIEITGKNLRDLLLGIQKHEMEAVRKTPSIRRGTFNDDLLVVHSICLASTDKENL